MDRRPAPTTHEGRKPIGGDASRAAAAISDWRRLRRRRATRVLISVAAICLGGVFTWLAVGTREHPNIKAEGVWLQQFVTASPIIAALRTHIEISYRNPISVDESADIQARITQFQTYAADPTFQFGNTSVPDPVEEKRLSFPASVTVKSAAFNFDRGENTRYLSAKAPLPITLRWAPVAKAAGDYELVFTFKNVNFKDTELWPDTLGTELSINNQKQTVGPGDDVVLHLTVNTGIGVSSRVYDWGLVGGAVASFFLGQEVLVGLGSRLWKWVAMMVARRRSGPKPERIPWWRRSGSKAKRPDGGAEA